MKRVCGYSKFCGDEKINADKIDLDDTVMIGDYLAGNVISNQRSTFCIAKILSLRDKDRKFNTAFPFDCFKTAQVTSKVMCTKLVDSNLIIVPSRSTHEVVWDGEKCTTIALQNLTIALDEAVELFNSLPLASTKSTTSSLLPYHDSLIDTVDAVVVKEKVPCKLCPKEVELKLMRLHVGKHILQENLINVCGFCGTQGCSIELTKSSGRGKSATQAPKSNCPHASKFSLKPAEKSTSSSPCTNRPVVCIICHTVVWSYMMASHYSQVHNGVPCPLSVTVEEREMVLGKK